MAFELKDQEPYSKVVRRVWGDDRFKAFSRDAKLLWFYLLTGPDCTVIPGLFTKMGFGTLADRLAFTYAVVKKAWGEIDRASQRENPMARADWPAGVIWLPKGIIHNPPANPNVVKNWRTVPLPDSPLVVEALLSLRARLSLRGSKDFVATFDELFRKRFPQICDAEVVNGSADSTRLALNYSGNGFEKSKDSARNGSGNGFGNQDQEQDQDSSTPQPPLAGGLTVSTRKPSKAESDWAEQLRRKSPSGCPHEDEGGPRCASWAECEGRMVARRRRAVADGMERELAELSEEAP